MPHARTVIRKAVKQAMLGLATTGPNVSTSISNPYPGTDLPAWLILTADDDAGEVVLGVEDGGEWGDFELRGLPVTMEGRAKAGGEPLEDLLDEMCLEAERAMSAAVAPGGDLYGLVKDVQLHSSSTTSKDEGEILVGEAHLEWVIQYRVAKADPSAPIQ